MFKVDNEVTTRIALPDGIIEKPEKQIGFALVFAG